MATATLSATANSGVLAPEIVSSRLGGSTPTSTSAFATANQGGGDWYEVLTSSSQKPSGTQIEAGTDHADVTAASSALPGLVLAAEVSLNNFTGLTPGATYFRHVVFKKDGQYSTVNTLAVTLPVDVGDDFGDTLTITNTVDLMSPWGPAPLRIDRLATSTNPRCVFAFHDVETKYEVLGLTLTYDMLLDEADVSKDGSVIFAPNLGILLPEGTWTIRQTSWDGISRVTQDIQRTVTSQDAQFAGEDTAVLSSSSNWTGAPAGASQHTTLASALAHLDTRTNKRLLIHHTETISDPIILNDTNGSNKNFAIGSYGGDGNYTTADRWRMNQGADNKNIEVRFDTNNYTRLHIQDFEFRGNYDARSTNPDRQGNAAIDIRDGAYETIKTFWNCDIEGVGSAGISIVGNNGLNIFQEQIYFGHIRVWNTYDYCIYTPEIDRFMAVGVTLGWPTGTRNGGTYGDGSGKYGNPWPRHGNFRASRVKSPSWTFWSHVCLNTFSDWSADISSQSFQRPIRWDNGSTGGNNELILTEFWIEGGRFLPRNETANESQADVVAQWVLIQNGTAINADHWSKPLDIQSGGTTVRNITLVVPDRRPGVGTGTQKMMKDDPGNSVAPGGQSRRSELYSYTFVDLRTDANSGKRNGTSLREFRPGDFENINPNYKGAGIEYCPNRTTLQGDVSQAPLNTTARYQVIYDGERWQDGAVDLAGAYNNDCTASFEPLTGSSAIGGATTKVSLLDRRGNYRDDIRVAQGRANFCEGPYEVALAA